MAKPETTEYLEAHLLNINLDTYDIWGYGRDAAQAGRLSDPALKASYPYVEIDFRDEVKWERVLKNHFEKDEYYRYPFLLRIHYVFFQNREDRDLFQGLMFLY